MKTAGLPKFTVWPPPGSSVSLGTWLREVAVLSKVTVAPPPFPRGAARGKGQPVMVFPGFCSLDASTARLRQFLTRQNFTTYPWDCGPNIGPTQTLLLGVERQLETMALRHGTKVALVGMSLGGTIAREMAKRRTASAAW